MTERETETSMDQENEPETQTVQVPMLEKMHDVKERSQACGELLEWLRTKGWVLGEYHEHDDGCFVGGIRVCGLKTDELVPVTYTIERLLAEFFEIDLKQVEDERRALLAAMQRAYGA